MDLQKLVDDVHGLVVKAERRNEALDAMGGDLVDLVESIIGIDRRIARVEKHYAGMRATPASREDQTYAALQKLLGR